MVNLGKTFSAARAALERFYSDTCTVYVQQKAESDDCLTRFESKVLYADQPCRLSFSSSTTASRATSWRRSARASSCSSPRSWSSRRAAASTSCGPVRFRAHSIISRPARRRSIRPIRRSRSSWQRGMHEGWVRLQRVGKSGRATPRTAGR